MIRRHQNAYREIITWKNLNHPNILPLLGVDTSISPLSTISEWMEYGSLRDYLVHFPNAPRSKLVTSFTVHIRYCLTGYPAVRCLTRPGIYAWLGLYPRRPEGRRFITPSVFTHVLFFLLVQHPCEQQPFRSPCKFPIVVLPPKARSKHWRTRLRL